MTFTYHIFSRRARLHVRMSGTQGTPSQAGPVAAIRRRFAGVQRPGKRARSVPKRVPRGLKGGNGAFGELVLMATASTNVSGIMNFQVNPNDASSGSEWASYAALFDSVRVRACKIEFYPLANVAQISTTGSVFAPIYVWYDKNSTYSALTPAQAIEYKTSKVFNMNMPWSYFVRLPKSVLNTTSEPGWQRTSAAGSATGYIGATTDAFTPASLTIGRYKITWYCEFRDAHYA